MQELRRHKRLTVPLQIEVRHPSFGTLEVAASDMSDGGIFLVMDDCHQLELGEGVIVRTLGLGPSGEDMGPPLVMTVVRKTKMGMGLSIEDSASANLESIVAEHFTQHALIQSLLLYNKPKQILLSQQGDHWRFPSRQLLRGETWKDGLKACIESLKQTSAFSEQSKFYADRQCYPNTNSSSHCVEMLVPCRVESLAPLPEPQDSSNLESTSFRWVNRDDLPTIATSIDSKLVDKILNQV